MNRVALAYVNKLKTVLCGTILLKFVDKRDKILSICKKDVIVLLASRYGKNLM